MEEYLDQLRERGFFFRDDRRTGHSREKLIHYITAIGQARFHDYAYPFQRALDQGKRVGADHILRLYRFDRKLRLLSLDAVERIEVSIKSHLDIQLRSIHGNNWHTRIELLNGLAPGLYENIQSDIRRSPIMKSLINSGKTYADFPSTRIMDNVSYGRVEILLKTLPPGQPLTQISRSFGLTNRIFLSWVATTRNIRNTAAHHSRLWNRRLQQTPIIPQDISSAIGDVRPDYVEKFYSAAIVLNSFASVAARNSQWRVRLRTLIEENNVGHIDLKTEMGFPDDWWETDYWK